jgi:hypothetical protein
MNGQDDVSLPEILRLNPRFWVYDPIPPWLLPILEKAVLRDLAISQLEAQREALQLQARALEKTLGIIKNARIG